MRGKYGLILVLAPLALVLLAFSLLEATPGHAAPPALPACATSPDGPRVETSVCVKPPPDLVGWWPGDGNTNDLSGRHNDGTLQNSATFAAGEVAQAFNLDGVDDYVRLDAASGDLNFLASDFTVEGWVNFTTTGTIRVIFANGYNLNPQVDLYISSDSHAHFFIRDDAAVALNVTGTTALNDGAWHHLAGVRQGTKAKVYVDGSQQGELSDGAFGTITSPCGFATLGGFNSSGICAEPATENFYSGLIDELSVYRRALTDAEIASIFNAGSAGKCKEAISGLSAANSGPTTLGHATRFTATVSAGSTISYAWTFGDGQSGSGPTTPHAYLAAGFYTAQVTATNGLGSVTATTPVTITSGQTPIAGLALTSNSPVHTGTPATLTATLTGGTNVNYAWNFGDGVVVSSGGSPTTSHVYAGTGQFTGVVTATNSVSSQSASTAISVVKYDLYLPLIVR